MSAAIPMEQLEVIGYADPPNEDMVPCVVPPVFRLIGEDRALVPPYLLSAGLVVRPVEIGMPEVEDLAATEDITLFENSFPAQPDFQLWLDQFFNPHYENRATAEQNLRDLGRQFIHDAKAAFRASHFDKADRLASAAISADPRCMESLVLKAAIRREENDPEGERLMADLADPSLDRFLFGMLVDKYSPAVTPKPVASEKVSPMYQMACAR
jgi:hypothetical protein